MTDPPELRHVVPFARRGPAYRAVCRLSATTVGLWLSENVAWKLDPALLSLTRGRLGCFGPLISAVLETRGTRTGRPRRTAVLYFHNRDHVVIVASKRGDARYPAWYYNLCAHPDVIFGGHPFRAETLVYELELERQRLRELADRVLSTVRRRPGLGRQRRARDPHRSLDTALTLSRSRRLPGGVRHRAAVRCESNTSS